MSSLPLLSSAAASIRAPQQLLLPGFLVTPPTDGLFLGILPEPTSRSYIADLAHTLRAQNRLEGKPLAADRLHLSLHDLSAYFDSGIDLVARITEAAAILNTPPFAVTFDRAVSFRRNSPTQAFVLKSSTELTQLNEFHHQLGLSLRKCGLSSRSPKHFTPHVTLLYDPRRIPEQSVTPVSWTVKEFVLVHSLLGQSRYIVLGRWPLHGPAHLLPSSGKTDVPACCPSGSCEARPPSPSHPGESNATG